MSVVDRAMAIDVATLNSLRTECGCCNVYNYPDGRRAARDLNLPLATDWYQAVDHAIRRRQFRSAPELQGKNSHVLTR
jgi:hypothetical protein